MKNSIVVLVLFLSFQGSANTVLTQFQENDKALVEMNENSFDRKKRINKKRKRKCKKWGKRSFAG